MLLPLLGVLVCFVFALPLIVEYDDDLTTNTFTQMILAGILWIFALMRLRKTIPCFIISTALVAVCCCNYAKLVQYKQKFDIDMTVNYSEALETYHKNLNAVRFVCFVELCMFLFYVYASWKSRKVAVQK